MQELVISIQAKQAGKSNQAEGITNSEECIPFLNCNKKNFKENENVTGCRLIPVC